MADGLNKVMLLGNLGADPELRSTAGGTAVLKLRIATTESYLDAHRERKERTEWHNVVIWGKRAEGLAKILAKGTRIFVEGGLRTTNYEKDGQRHYKTDVNATRVILCGGKSAQSGTPDDDSNGNGGEFDDPPGGSGDDEFPF